MYLPYTVGEGSVFSKKDIEIAKKSTSFEREYNLKFLGLVGIVFLSLDFLNNEKKSTGLWHSIIHDVFISNDV
jgi:hypothetical protein